MIHPNDPLAKDLFEKEPNILMLAKSSVDGEQWYTISCLRDVSMWIHNEHSEQENKLWFENTDSRWRRNFNVFDVHEKFYSILALRWL
jgi:hypothetical protein